MIETISNIVSIVLVSVNIAIVVVSFIISKINKKRLGTSVVDEEDKSTTENSTGIIELVKSIIPQAIELAEKSGLVTGESKKLVALSKIMLQCSENGIDYQANADLIDSTLEELINFSKSVNAKEETK